MNVGIVNAEVGEHTAPFPDSLIPSIGGTSVFTFIFLAP